MTYFGSASTPADNGANPGPTATVTPPGSMVAGDLVTVLVQYRSGGGLLLVTVTGGQTWETASLLVQAGNVSTIVFYCIFNGIWSTNPIFGELTMGTAALSAVMHVFRPTSGYSFQGLDAGVSYRAEHTAPSTPFDVTIPADTSTQDRIVALAAFATSDDNTWALQTAGWTNAGSAQYRNTTGQDQSNSTAYKFFTSAGTIEAVTNRQATLGGDATVVLGFGFYETALSVGRSFGAIID